MGNDDVAPVLKSDVSELLKPVFRLKSQAMLNPNSFCMALSTFSLSLIVQHNLRVATSLMIL